MRSACYVILLNRADHQPIRVLLSSFDMLERDSILKRFSLGFRPADVGYPFTSESDHERVFALDFL